MKKEFFKVAIDIMKRNNLYKYPNIDKGYIYYLELQTRPFEENNEIKRYMIKAYSDNKIDIYNSIVEIHKYYSIDCSFLKKADLKKLEEYVFHIPQLDIEARFSSEKIKNKK